VLLKLAKHLARGARLELDVTPKPGLVDRHDSGAHRDLTYASMRASVALLPQYYDDLIARLRAGEPLSACIDAGRRAEKRMLAKIGSNAHRGYIFLSGLTLIATHRVAGNIRALPRGIAEAACEFFRNAPPEPSHGASARRRFSVRGIRGEAEAGLPCIFAAAWPHYAASLRRDRDEARAAFCALASLMQCVEDTTALHRCGVGGLLRLRRDGRALELLLNRGSDPRPFLRARNAAYRQAGLTMGGIGDCLALTLALHDCFARDRRCR